MPKLNTEINNLPGGFSYSGIRMEDLEAAEYTLVTIVLDISGSVQEYIERYKEMLNTIIDSCRKSPRVENLLIRTVLFESNVEEYHGFKLIEQIKDDEYDDIESRGCTALYDATYLSIEAMMAYSQRLFDVDIDVNGIIFIITDGLDNDSKTTKDTIEKLLKGIKGSEKLESLVTILIALKDPNISFGNYQDVARELDSFKGEVGIDSCIDIGDLDKGKLAKLANFVSQSISSQSQSLGTGGTSVKLTI